jgi:hypothetical protein
MHPFNSLTSNRFKSRVEGKTDTIFFAAMTTVLDFETMVFVASTKVFITNTMVFAAPTMVGRDLPAVF